MEIKRHTKNRLRSHEHNSENRIKNCKWYKKKHKSLKSHACYNYLKKSNEDIMTSLGTSKFFKNI